MSNQNASERLTSRSCEDFAAVLASKEPVPGGGGAAALAGALAAALCSMVGNYTTGKKAYAEVEDDVQRMLRDAESARLRLLALIQEDADAFLPLSVAYGMAKDDPTRAATIEEATKRACAAPMEMMRLTCDVIELLEEMEWKGSRMLLSDVGCGAYLAQAALEAASLNVYVNTRTIADKDFVAVTEGEAYALLDKFLPRARECANAVMARIRG